VHEMINSFRSVVVVGLIGTDSAMRLDSTERERERERERGREREGERARLDESSYGHQQ